RMESVITRPRLFRLARQLYRRASPTSPTSLALGAFLTVSLFLASNAAAFALRLGNGGPLGARFAPDLATVLYAGDVQGHFTRTIGVGDTVADGKIVDIGIPTTMPDGSVLFAAEIYSP